MSTQQRSSPDLGTLAQLDPPRARHTSRARMRARTHYHGAVEDTPYAARYDASERLLTVTGSIDELSGPNFRSDLEKYSEGFTQDLTVDLGGVDFFPSLAVGVLAVAAKNARNAGHEIDVIAEPGSIVARVLTISALPYRERS